MRLLIVWLINAAALMALPYLLPAIKIPSFGTALLAALLLGLINAFIRPLLILLTLPVTVFSLGFFILIINALLFLLVTRIIPSFGIIDFWTAFWASILYSVLSWALATLLLTPVMDPLQGE